MKGVNGNAANAAGETSMHAAAIRGADAIVEFLAKNGAQVDCPIGKITKPPPGGRQVFKYLFLPIIPEWCRCSMLRAPFAKGWHTIEAPINPVKQSVKAHPEQTMAT